MGGRVCQRGLLVEMSPYNRTICTRIANIQRSAPRECKVAEGCANRAKKAKKEPMARWPLACLVNASVLVRYDTLSRLRSIFLWQHDNRCRAVCFGENPYRVTGAGGIGGENAPPLRNGQLIFLLIRIRDLTPVAVHMPVQKLCRKLLCLL
jgi:hypothetical protein